MTPSERNPVYRDLAEAMAAKAARPDRLKGARDANRARREARVARAKELKAQGKTAARIAQIMGDELGYPVDRPLSPDAVRRWLRPKKADATT